MGNSVRIDKTPCATFPVLQRANQGAHSEGSNSSATTVPGETDHEWPEALWGTVLNDIISHCPEGLPNGWQIWECMWPRCVLDRKGEVMSWRSSVASII